MTTDSLRAVPRHYRGSQFGYRRLLAGKPSGVWPWKPLVRVFSLQWSLGWRVPSGEALAIQMVVGNSAVVPTSLNNTSCDLDICFDNGDRKPTVMGTVDNNVLWSLALVLLLMSLAFNSVIKLITKEKEEKLYAKEIKINFTAAVLYTIAGIIVAILASLILYILVRGLPHISWSFLTGKSLFLPSRWGIGIQLYNSFFLWSLPWFISVPLSIGLAFSSLSMPKRTCDQFVRTCVEILSSLPSVVVGLFGYLIFVVQFEYGFSIIARCLGLDSL